MTNEVDNEANEANEAIVAKEIEANHGNQDDLILSAKIIRIAPENSSF